MRHYWKRHQPRTNLPVFGDVLNEVSFVVQPERRSSLRVLLSPLFRFMARGLPWKIFLDDCRHVLFPKPYFFSFVYISSSGEEYGVHEKFGPYREGDFFYLNINSWMVANGINQKEGNLIIFANRGRPDRWQSSPGNVEIRYTNQKYIAGFRTGFFARPLNEAGKIHLGYRGVNPGVVCNAARVSGILLINHSSNPLYSTSVSPVVRLYRPDGQYLESEFGSISPHSFVEKSIPQLFSGWKEFLRPCGGRGFTIASLEGFTLASMHTVRDERGNLVAIEHSRPGPANVIKFR